MRPTPLIASLLSFVCCPTAAFASALEITDLPAASDVELGIGLELDDYAGEALGQHVFADVTVPISNGAEVSFRTGMERQHRSDGQFQHSFSGAQVAVKYEIIREGPGRIGVTVEPAIILPSTGNAIGFDQAQVVIPVVVGLALDRWQLRSLLGIEQTMGGGEGKYHAGIAAEHSVTDNLLIGAEVVSNFAMHSFDDQEYFVNAGLALALAQDTELHFRVGARLFGPNDGSEAKAFAKFILHL